MAEQNLARVLTTREERLTALHTGSAITGWTSLTFFDPASDPRPAFAALSSWLSDALPPRN